MLVFDNAQMYILQSIPLPHKFYVGSTADLERRFKDHNAGQSTHTKKYKPWNLVWYCSFPSKIKAVQFEKYLKTGSGRRFQKVHYAIEHPPIRFGRSIRFETVVAAIEEEAKTRFDVFISLLYSRNS